MVGEKANAHKRLREVIPDWGLPMCVPCTPARWELSWTFSKMQRFTPLDNLPKITQEVQNLGLNAGFKGLPLPHHLPLLTTGSTPGAGRRKGRPRYRGAQTGIPPVVPRNKQTS